MTINDFRFPVIGDCGTQRIWTVLRKVGDPVTIQDLCRICETTYQPTKRYVCALVRMGYVEKAGYRSAGPTGGTVTLYRLVNDTGPKHPYEKKVWHVYHDPNTGKTWWDMPTEAEALSALRDYTARARQYSNYQKTTDRPSWKRNLGGDDERTGNEN